MKKLLIIAIAIFCSVSAYAQISSDCYLTFKGGKFYSNGVEVKNEALVDVLGAPLYSTSYTNGMKMYDAGRTCTIVGGSMAGLGIAGLIITDSIKSSSSVKSTFQTLSFICMYTGIVGIVPGIVFMSVGKAKLKSVAAIHNASRQSQISFEPAQSGIGLCMKF